MASEELDPPRVTGPNPPEAELFAGETLDSIGLEPLWVIQRRRGYRFSIDALLLADFAGGGHARALDLGAGSGVVGLLLALRGQAGHVVAVERQPGLCRLLERNARLNGLDGRLTILEADFRALPPLDPVALVVSNPPYFPEGSGVVNPDGEKAAARHELHGGLGEVVAAAQAVLAPGGALALVLPAHRLDEAEARLARAGLRLARRRAVHTRTGQGARLVLLAATREAVAPVTEPPLTLYDGAGAYTAEALRVIEGRPKAR